MIDLATVVGLAILLPLAISLSTSVRAGPLEAGNFEQVVATVNKILEAKPGALPMYTRLGIANARAGKYSEALDAFERGGPNVYYLSRGYGDHALALRGQRRCSEAVSVRMMGRWSDDAAEAEVSLYVDAVDDWAACDDLDEAEALAFDGFLIDPDAAGLHAALADVYRARGEPARADYHLEVARTAEPHGWRTLLAEVNAASAEARWAEMSEHMMLLGQRKPRHPALFVAQLRSLTFRGRWAEALQLCSAPSWLDHEDSLLATLRGKVFDFMGQGHLAKRRSASRMVSPGWRR